MKIQAALNIRIDNLEKCKKFSCTQRKDYTKKRVILTANV